VSGLEIAAVALAGVAAGFINAVAGSGTLVTFPTLLAFGVPPVTANVSNNVGLVPGSISAAFGLREELRGQRRRILRLGTASLVGGVVGALLLLALPSEAFDTIVPALVGLGVLLVAFQPRINRWLAERRRRAGLLSGAEPVPESERPEAGWLWPGVAVTGIYGGYFGAAQGILLIAILGLALPDDLQRINALKNVLAGSVNLVSGLIFIAVADPAWEAVALIAAGAAVGGWLGARYGRRLPPAALRAVIVVVGLAAIVQLLVR
jgi:uncharacterized protein